MVLSLMFFGITCTSRSHHLDEDMDYVCTSGSGRNNSEAVEDHLNKVTDWSTLWEKNAGGGWICGKGNLCHPRAEPCCCGEPRVKMLADLLVSLKPLLNKKIKREEGSRIQPLDHRYNLSALACAFEDHTSNFLFNNMGMAKDKEEDALQFTPSNITLT